MGFREVILPGAFADAILIDDVKFLLNHAGLPIARTRSRTLILSEDNKGLAFRAELEPTDPDVQRLLPKVRRGDVNEMSFAFGVENPTDETWTREKGETVRTLIRVRLSDISAVTYPAYPQTDISARSFYEARMKDIAAPVIDPDEDPEKVKAEMLARIKARREFLAARPDPKPDPLSLAEILKNARIDPAH